MNKKRYSVRMHVLVLALFLVLTVAAGSGAEENAGLQLAVFDIDATPPIGAHLAYNPVINTWDMSLRARGIVLTGAGEPIVLCAVDWVGIGSEGHDMFRQILAEAAGTDMHRVAVHTVHQHDAPGCDFTAERILKEHGITPHRYEGTFHREVLQRLDTAVRDAMEKQQPITHLGLGSASVHKVASNRRILGPDGKVGPMRGSSCRNKDLIAAPEGVIDPELSLVSFWNGDTPVAVLSYYACHPQSYYRTGIPNPDYPGIARFMRQLAVPQALHVHFDGAGGNVAAGKYNDGSKEMRLILAQRLEDGMRRAWEATERTPINAAAIRWTVEPVGLPVAEGLNAEELEKRMLEEENMTVVEDCARKLAWLQRREAGIPIDVACLSLGNARILHLPAELFVEYQLMAKAERPDLFVAMAAYGDYTPGYICTEIAYEQGGYEATPRSSNVSPKVEAVLTEVIQTLLQEQ